MKKPKLSETKGSEIIRVAANIQTEMNFQVKETMKKELAIPG